MWTNKYIGIPYKDAGDDVDGCDCWGLVRLVYKNEFDIELPSFKEVRYNDYAIRSQEIRDQIPDNWQQTQNPVSGSCILLRVKGLPIHIGVMINNTEFLNILPGANCVIANINNAKWRNRIIGFYNYSSQKLLETHESSLLTGIPHPLKKQVYTLPIIPGITLSDVNNIIRDTYKVPKELYDRIVFTINGIPASKETWNTYKLKPGDRVEYRARPGWEAFIAEILFYIEYGVTYASAAEGIGAVGTAASSLTAAGVYTASTISIIAAAASIVGTTAISYALAPPRPTLPTSENPGSAEAQYLAVGSANQLNRYGSIPIILGKMRIVPPLGAMNYLNYFGADERNSYLNMLLTWGYGPLKLHNWKPNSVNKELTSTGSTSYYKWDAGASTNYSGLKLGNSTLDTYTITGISHKNIYDGDYTGSNTNLSIENPAGFDSIYGQDQNQIFKNQPIINDIHPLNGVGTVANPVLTAVDASVPALPAGTPSTEYYSRMEIALHFPEGLRKIRIKGDNDNAGKSYSLYGTDNLGIDVSNMQTPSRVNPSILTIDMDGAHIPLILKFEYKLNAGSWTPLKIKDLAGNETDNNGLFVLGEVPYKDAFTRVFYADNTVIQTTGSSIFPFNGQIDVRVSRLTGGRGEAPAEGTTEYTSWGTGNISTGRCYLINDLTPVVDGTGAIVEYYVTRTLQGSITTSDACLVQNTDALLDSGQRYSWEYPESLDNNAGSVTIAQNWTILHKVHFLSFTVSRNAKPIVAPKVKSSSGTDSVILSQTALRINSTEQLNGQLEGISGVVQTLGREYTGSTINDNTADATKWIDLQPINNPASLFLHVLTSPANPKRILWNEITNKVDLVKIQKWWRYCTTRPSYTFTSNGISRTVGGPFTYNQIVGSAKSVLDVLKDIAAAGRASPAMVDGKWTVNIDEEKSTIVQMFTPHNSWDFTSTRNLERLPDGLRVNFYDEDNDYQEAEIVVYNKGKDESNSVLFESINFQGITKASLVEDHAKWVMAQAIVRRELYTLNTDIEYLICNRGDRVTVTHNVPRWGYSSGRINKRLTMSDGISAEVVELDEPVILDPSKSYGIRIRSNSLSSQSVEKQILVTNIPYQSISRASDGLTITVVMPTNKYPPFVVGDELQINSSGDFGTTSSAPAVVTSVSSNSFTYIKAGIANATAGSSTINLTNGLYKRIQFTSAVGTYTSTKRDGVTTFTENLAEEGDLFLFGEYQNISNDLLVLAIEPDNNKGARLTLVDYAYDSLFKLSTGFPSGITGTTSGIPAYLSQTENLIFRPNISSKNDLDGFTEADLPPDIGIPYDDEALITPGTKAIIVKVPYANRNATDINGKIISSYPTDIVSVECQYALNIAGAQINSIKVGWTTCLVTIPDLEIGKQYKIRLRYVKRDGRVGSWSIYRYHTVSGRIIGSSSVLSIEAYLSGTELVVVPYLPEKPPEFKWFEVRIWKNNTVLTSDFWNNSTVTSLIRDGQSTDTNVLRVLRSPNTDTLRTDLKTFGAAGSIISNIGVRYKIACRFWDGKNYSPSSALTTWIGKTITASKHSITNSIASLNLQVISVLENGRPRTDLWGMRVWMSKPVTNTTTNTTTPANPSFTADDTTLVARVEGQSAIIDGLTEVEKTHYFRYALISAIDPTVWNLSNSYAYIPRASLVANTLDIPPDPAGIEAAAAITSIIVTLPTVTNLNPTPPAVATQATDYGGGDYTSGSNLSLKASSRHKSTVVYGKVVNSLLDEPGFSAVQNNVMGEFEEKTVFTLPADPGTVYALFFKYRNRAGNLSANAFGPVMVETGINVQKFLDMLADQITEGQLFKGLQSRLSRTDRMPQVDASVGQYTVKIDNGGHVAGFGLSNTSRKIQYGTDGKATKQLTDGRPFSEFGVVADRFWISGTAVQSDTEPTTDLYHGMRWIDTGSAGNNEGVIFGPLVYYNVYQPSVHNTVTFEDNGNYWYWELKTKTELDKLIFSGVTYVNKGTWIAGTTYAKNDYVFEKDSNVYYVCLLAHTPVLVSNFATKNPKKIGTFTGSGASFAVGKTLYLKGAERLPTGATELAAAGTNPTYKLNPDYNPLGTFYYITDVSGTEFTLSLKPKGEPVASGISALVKYYQITTKPNPAYNLDPTKGAIDTKAEIIDTQGFVNAPTSSMFPFVVETGTSAGIRPGVYMDSAMIRDASITNAKIANLAVDSAKIAYLEAGKITTGKLKADLIEAGAITIDNIDITSLRGKTTGTWTLAMPTLSTSEVSRTIDLPPGNYELILSSTFGRYDEFLGSDTFKEETAKVKCEITGVPGAEVEAIGYWRKTVDSTKLDIKIKDKKADITTQPTYTFSGGVTADIPPGPPGPPGPPAPPADGGGGGGGGCLLYGTPVLMHDNTIKNMEDLQVGDIIKSTIIEGLSTEEDGWKQYSTNLFNCSPTLVTVTGVRLDTFHSYYNINNNLLKITYEHPVLVRRGNEYSFIQVIDLIVNDFIYHEINGWIQVISKEFINELIQTVSIDTEFEDVYFANGILVHNSNMEKN